MFIMTLLIFPVIFDSIISFITYRHIIDHNYSFPFLRFSWLLNWGIIFRIIVLHYSYIANSITKYIICRKWCFFKLKMFTSNFLCLLSKLISRIHFKAEESTCYSMFNKSIHYCCVCSRIDEENKTPFEVTSLQM